MKQNLSIYYDEEGDFLELSVGKSKKGLFKNLGKGVFKRVTDKNKVVGIAIHGFRKRKSSINLPIKVEMSA